jgi:hypothetical protein
MHSLRAPFIFLKDIPSRVEETAREKGIAIGAIEIRFTDEGCIARKNKITRRWAQRGTRACSPPDQPHASTYIFGAVCPWEGKGAAVVLLPCSTAAMNLHPAEISARASPGRHGVLLLDQRGWHLSCEVALPDNITLLPLPPKCPEPNVMEKVWHFRRANWLSNRIFHDHTTSSGAAATTGTASSISPCTPCPSGCAPEHVGYDPWRLLLAGCAALSLAVDAAARQAARTRPA